MKRLPPVASFGDAAPKAKGSQRSTFDKLALPWTKFNINSIFLIRGYGQLKSWNEYYTVHNHITCNGPPGLKEEIATDRHKRVRIAPYHLGLNRNKATNMPQGVTCFIEVKSQRNLKNRVKPWQGDIFFRYNGGWHMFALARCYGAWPSRSEFRGGNKGWTENYKTSVLTANSRHLFLFALMG